MAVMNLNKRLKSILLKGGVLDEECLGEALIKAEDEGQSLTEVLIEGDHLTEADVIAALSDETHLPPINVDKIQTDDKLITLLPQNLANYYGVIPVSRVANVLTLAVSNPFDILQLDDVQIVTGCEIRPVICTDYGVKKAIPEIYNRGQKAVSELLDNMVDSDVEMKEGETEDEDDIGAESEDAAPVVKLVNLIIVDAIRKKASDIHIEPGDRTLLVRYRIDGVLRAAMSPPKKMQSAIASRIKIIAGLDIAEKRRPQDGKFQIRLDGRKIDFRTSILPVIHGEKVVMRILDSSNLTLSLDTLGFETKALRDIRESTKKPYGMLLVTGPTGSGKSTTLYSCITEVLCVEDNIVTVEDPVEYELDGINQVQINIKRGLTFAGALRSILRQDPDTILIGEIRDLETIEIAVKAALTGHLVFSTLHTNDAPSTITRIVDMGIEPFLAASSILCVCAQRLAKKLCDDCKKPVVETPPVERLLQMGFANEDLEGVNLEFYEPNGCNRCAKGYKGRFALVETMPLNDELRRLIIKGGTALDIKDLALQQKMLSLRRVGLLNALRGRTSLSEVNRVTMGD